MKVETLNDRNNSRTRTAAIIVSIKEQVNLIFRIWQLQESIIDKHQSDVDLAVSDTQVGGSSEVTRYNPDGGETICWMAVRVRRKRTVRMLQVRSPHSSCQISQLAQSTLPNGSVT